MMDPEIPKNEGFFDSIELVVPAGLRAQPAAGQAGVAPAPTTPAPTSARSSPSRCSTCCPTRPCPQTYKTGIPTIIVGVDPRTGPAVHRPLGRGLRRLVQRGEGHGRLGLRRTPPSATSGRRPPRSTRASTRTSSGAATTAPTPAGPASGAGLCGSHYVKEVRVDAKVYTYVVGMKYPMPGIAAASRARRTSMMHPLRLRRPVRRAAHRRLGADRGRRSGSCYDYGGGGGWGDPLDRDPQAVLDDVLDEYVSRRGRRARLRRRAHRLARGPHARGRRRRDRRSCARRAPRRER